MVSIKVASSPNPAGGLTRRRRSLSSRGTLTRSFLSRVPNSRAACPDYTCNPCKFDEKCPPVNFTGITSIICSYKYDVCDRLRVEHRACRKAQARMCRPVEKQVKTVCTKEVNRAWTKKCKEDEEKLDAGLKDLMAQLDALRALKPGNCGCAAPEPPPKTYTPVSYTHLTLPTIRMV